MTSTVGPVTCAGVDHHSAPNRATAAIARTIRARRSDFVPGSNANGNKTNAASDKWADRISANPIGPEPGNGMRPPRSRAATANTYPAIAAVNTGTRVRGDRFCWDVPVARTGRSTLIATPTIAQAGALRASGVHPLSGPVVAGDLADEAVDLVEERLGRLGWQAVADRVLRPVGGARPDGSPADVGKVAVAQQVGQRPELARPAARRRARRRTARSRSRPRGGQSARSSMAGSS